MPSKTKPVKPKVVDMLNNPVSRAVSEKLLGTSLLQSSYLRSSCFSENSKRGPTSPYNFLKYFEIPVGMSTVRKIILPHVSY